MFQLSLQYRDIVPTRHAWLKLILYVQSRQEIESQGRMEPELVFSVVTAINKQT